jgi:transcriptional regulator with XRE-family HTH domain
MPLRDTFADLCRTGRNRLHMTQRQLGAKVGVSRGYIANIERRVANPSLDLIERIAHALDVDLDFAARMPAVLDIARQRDLVHARCSGYVDRRFRSAGWLTAREVEIASGRSHGWIDLLAFRPASELLLVTEIKTRLDDIGAIERQLGWYERSAFRIARDLGWQPRRSVSWLLALASDEVEETIRSNVELMGLVFPVRAAEMSALLEAGEVVHSGRGVALIDPSSKRAKWLIRSRVDGRRSPAAYAGYADAARRFTA